MTYLVNGMNQYYPRVNQHFDVENSSIDGGFSTSMSVYPRVSFFFSLSLSIYIYIYIHIQVLHDG